MQLILEPGKRYLTVSKQVAIISHAFCTIDGVSMYKGVILGDNIKNTYWYECGKHPIVSNWDIIEVSVD